MAVKPGKNTISVSYFQAFLARWVEATGLKKREIADGLGIAPSSLGDYLSGTKVPSLGQMEDIAKKINNDLIAILAEGRAILEGEELLESEEQRPVIIPQGISEEELDSYNFLRIPFRDDMRLFAGGGAVPGTYESAGSPVVIHRDSITFRANPKDLVTFRVGGDSMEPLLAKNGIVAVDTSHNDLRRLKEGDIYALCWDRDEECAVKRLRWAVPAELLAVESTDPVVNPTIYLEPEDRSVFLIGRVVWAWREF